MDIASRVRRRFSDRAQPGDGAPAPSQVEAIYARILDGDTLWLAVVGVEGPEGELALRDRATGALVSVPSRAETLQGERVLGARFDLITDLVANLSVDRGGRGGRGGRAVAYDVLAIESPGDQPVPVWSAPLPTRGPTKAPVSRDGRWQLAVVAEPEGLRIVGEPAAQAALPLSFGRTDTTLEVRLRLPAGAEPRLLVLGADDAVLHSFTLSFDDPVEDPAEGREGWTAVLPELELADLAGPAPLAVLHDGDLIPVLRHPNDLRFPNSAVALPDLPGLTDSALPLLRFRYLPSGQLAVARPVEDTPAVADAQGTVPKAQAAE